MGSQYYIVPLPTGATFTSAAVEEMSRWWDRHPVYRRSDGAIAVCRDVAYRDWVLSVAAEDRISVNVEVLVLAPDKVTLGILGWQDRIDMFYDFIAFCQSRWSCVLVDQTEKQQMTAEEYREMMHRVYDYPES